MDKLSIRNRKVPEGVEIDDPQKKNHRDTPVSKPVHAVEKYRHQPIFKPVEEEKSEGNMYLLIGLDVLYTTP